MLMVSLNKIEIFDFDLHSTQHFAIIINFFQYYFEFHLKLSNVI